MSWIALIVVGGIVGWLAGVVMRTSQQQGIVPSILIGIAGACIGNLLFASIYVGTFALGRYPLSPATLVSAFVGSIILIALLKLVGRMRRA